MPLIYNISKVYIVENISVNVFARGRVWICARSHVYGFDRKHLHV